MTLPPAWMLEYRQLDWAESPSEACDALSSGRVTRFRCQLKRDHSGGHTALVERHWDDKGPPVPPRIPDTARSRGERGQ